MQSYLMTNCCLQLQIDTCLIICYMHANLVAVTRVQMFPSIIPRTTNKRKRVREQNKKGQEWQLRDVFLPVIYQAWLTIFLNSPSQTEICKLTNWASGQERGETWEKPLPSAPEKGCRQALSSIAHPRLRRSSPGGWYWIWGSRAQGLHSLL